MFDGVCDEILVNKIGESYGDYISIMTVGMEVDVVYDDRGSAAMGVCVQR